MQGVLCFRFSVKILRTASPLNFFFFFLKGKTLEKQINKEVKKNCLKMLKNILIFSFNVVTDNSIIFFSQTKDNEYLFII